MFGWLFRKRDVWTVEGFSNQDGKHFFRLKAANGEITAQSEGYAKAWDRDETMRRLTEVRIVLKGKA